MKKSNDIPPFIPPFIPPCHLRMGVNIICIAVEGKLHIQNRMVQWVRRMEPKRSLKVKMIRSMGSVPVALSSRAQ